MTRLYGKIGVPFVSAFILIVLALQAFAGFVDTGRWGWPFLAYPMYKTAHYDGERILDDFILYAETSDGDRIKVSREDLGMSFWLFEKHIANTMINGESGRLQTITNDYCKKFNRSVVRLILEDKGSALSYSGITNGLPPQVLASADVVCE